ncbi:hypothetical protein FPV67DRAFT_158324 [Lyophyllum atratum]|nr:hypothetical protein FPV67DRAFT_158324 [Lyophyllum atratum]
MKFAISATIASLAGLVASTGIPRQSCPQASRFGVLTVTPSGAFNPGDNINIHVDFSCGINTFGIVPKYLDYTIEVPAASNNGHEPPIVLARRVYLAGAESDIFTTQIPHAFYFAGATTNLVFTNTYAIAGTDGSEVLVQGGVSAGITINA